MGDRQELPTAGPRLVKKFGHSGAGGEWAVELACLSAELADLGFSTCDFRDRDYALFVTKLAQHKRLRKPTLTAEEQAEQDRIASDIIEEILAERGHTPPRAV